MEDSYLIEDYIAAKTELRSAIDMQYKILSIIVTATAAVFVYLFKKDISKLVFCGCLIIPGIYAFFGILWLDQVYRQRRLAAYIYEIETYEVLPSNPSTSVTGWEHFVRNKRSFTNTNTPSRYYYYICLGLFFFFPFFTYFFSSTFSGGSVLNVNNSLFFPSLLGIILYVAFVVFAILYIKSILELGYSFEISVSSRSSNNHDPDDTPGPENFGFETPDSREKEGEEVYT